MGNLLSCAGLPRSLSRDDVVKLVHSHGLVEEFYRAVRVAELSVDYPHHFICSSRQICRGHLRKLSEEENMELGQIYFLLPSKLFELPLRQADVAALFSKAGTARKSSYKDLLVSIQQEVKPLEGEDVQKENKPDVRFSRDLICKLIAETRLKLETQMQQKSAIPDSKNASFGGGVSELKTAYAHHVLARSCTKLWRPPLETIKEDNFTVS